MPTGAVIAIMESVEAKQIESADRAVRLSLESLGHAEVAGAIMFDCSCRKSILCDRFGEAVRAMRKALGEGAPFAGFETYGEIALQVGDCSGFHNTTTVAVTIPR
jgi:methyl-accepting chemotaxis protein